VLERDGWLYTYFEEPGDLSGFIELLRSRVSSAIGNEEIHLVTRWQANEDWSEKWKRGLGPKRITDTIVVRPSWVQFNPEPDDIVIVIDPGMAFGTAEHGTTRGSLRLLARALKVDDRILDVGSGSGILAIAAAALGASEAIAIEGDSPSFEALQKNVEENAVSSRINCVEEWADTQSLQAMGPVDGIVANIETGVLCSFLPTFRNALIEDGWLVLSGILSMEWPRFLENTKAEGFRCVEVDRDGEWTSGLFRSV
jgi:ribosomal protein L11 methyltransferase